MKITVQQFSDAVIKWIETDLVNKGNPFQQGVLTFIMLQGKTKLTEMLNSLSYLSDNGSLDLELLHQNMARALNKMGGKLTIPFINYNLDNSDLNSIFTIARGSTNENS